MCKPPLVYFYTTFLVLVFLSNPGFAESHLAVETYENGAVKQEIPLLNGQRHGLARWYNEKGELTDVAYYWMGQETELYQVESTNPPTGARTIRAETPDGWRIITMMESDGTISTLHAIPPNKDFPTTHSTDPESGEITITSNRGGGFQVVTRINRDGKFISREEVVPEEYEQKISTTNWKTGETVTISRAQDGLMAIVKTDRCGSVISRQPWRAGDTRELHEYVSKLLSSENPVKWPDDCEATLPLKEVVDEFNASVDGNPPGKDQPPITEAEVIAVLISARAKYVNNYEQYGYEIQDFDLFESIANTKRLPAGSKLSVITQWGSHPYTVAVWWVDLEIPNTRIRIRDRMIGVLAKRL